MTEPASLTRVPRFRAGTSAVMVVLCAVVIAAGGLFYLWQRFQFTKLGFDVARLRQEKAEIEERLEPLQVEVDYLSRLERIDELAREQFGMRPPAPGQVIVLEGHAPAP
jgi:cell division protein FtsL